MSPVVGVVYRPNGSLVSNWKAESASKEVKVPGSPPANLEPISGHFVLLHLWRMHRHLSFH